MNGHGPSSIYAVLIGFCIGGALLHAACSEATQWFPVRTLEAGDHSGKFVEDLRFLVISRSETFAELYGQIASLTLPERPPPVIEFTKYHVLIALLGARPTAGYGIGFAETARRQSQSIEVQLLRTTPPQDAISAQAVTNPYVIAVVARDRYTKVTLVDELGAVIASIDVLE